MTVIIAGPTLAMWNDLDLVPARIYAAMAQREMREREREREMIAPFQPPMADSGAAKATPDRSRSRIPACTLDN